MEWLQSTKLLLPRLRLNGRFWSCSYFVVLHNAVLLGLFFCQICMLSWASHENACFSKVSPNRNWPTILLAFFGTHQDAFKVMPGLRSPVELARSFPLPFPLKRFVNTSRAEAAAILQAQDRDVVKQKGNRGFYSVLEQHAPWSILLQKLGVSIVCSCCMVRRCWSDSESSCRMIDYWSSWVHAPFMIPKPPATMRIACRCGIMWIVCMGGGESATISIFVDFLHCFSMKKLISTPLKKTQSVWHVSVSKLQKVHSQSLIPSFRDAGMPRCYARRWKMTCWSSWGSSSIPPCGS